MELKVQRRGPVPARRQVVGFPELAEKDRVDAMGTALQRLKGYVEPYRVVVMPRIVVCVVTVSAAIAPELMSARQMGEAVMREGER